MKNKSLFKHLVPVLVSVLLTSCGPREPIKEVSTNNPEYNVQLLFEVDGCKVYRFADSGRILYFTTCQGSISWSETHGRRSTYNYEVDTTIK
jgi:uncharacterized lipoprotein YehR (DUF1307 family)